MVVLRNNDFIIQKGQRYYLMNPKTRKILAIVKITKVTGRTSEARVLKGRPKMSLLALPYKAAKKLRAKKTQPKAKPKPVVVQEKPKVPEEPLLANRGSGWSFFIGPRLGVTVFNGKLDDVDTEYSLGFAGGFQFGYGNRYLSFESGASYVQQSVKAEAGGSSSTLTLNYLVIPIDVRFKYPIKDLERIYLKLGYSFNDFLSGKVTIRSPILNVDEDIDGDGDTKDNQIRIGLGYEVKKSVNYSFEVLYITGKNLADDGTNFKNQGFLIQFASDWVLF